MNGKSKIPSWLWLPSQAVCRSLMTGSRSVFPLYPSGTYLPLLSRIAYRPGACLSFLLRCGQRRFSADLVFGPLCVPHDASPSAELYQAAFSSPNVGFWAGGSPSFQPSVGWAYLIWPCSEVECLPCMHFLSVTRWSRNTPLRCVTWKRRLRRRPARVGLGPA